MMENRHHQLSNFRALAKSHLNLWVGDFPALLVKASWVGMTSMGCACLTHCLPNRTVFPDPHPPLRPGEMLRCAVATVIRLALDSPWTEGWKPFGIVPFRPCQMTVCVCVCVSLCVCCMNTCLEGRVLSFLKKAQSVFKEEGRHF